MALTHFDNNGKARMVDVSHKDDTERIARAKGSIELNEAAYGAVLKGESSKGDVLAVATVAGIMGAKKTWELIPMCHSISLTGCDITFEKRPRRDSGGGEVICTCTVKTTGKTGAEMEALTGVSTALLTVYDMLKAVDRGMKIGEIYLMEKDGGKSGHYLKEDNNE